ncbi:phage terminase, small subunit, putative, P27 family [Rhizobiales bacterium GAS191]|nr:phage terminase, small subunit, putative, P27 family [Rhizobiales bacterium GAS191]
MPGRKPTPPYLKLLRGNPGKRALRPSLPVERPSEPPRPLAFLPPYAAEEWRRLAPQATRLGVLSPLDWGPFGAYCEAYSTWRLAVEALDRIRAAEPRTGGLLVKGADGGAVANPLVRIERAAAETMLRAAGEFGLTPVARAHLASPPPDPGKFAGLLAGDGDGP